MLPVAIIVVAGPTKATTGAKPVVNINEVNINCVLSAEASKFDLIIVNEGVINVIPITEPALANAKIIIAKRFKDKI